MSALYEIRKAFVDKIIDNVTFVSQTNMQLSENKKISPQSDQEWLRLTVRTGASFDGEIGGIDWQRGIAFVDIFYPLNEGDNTVMTHAQSLVPMFRNVDLLYDVKCTTVDAVPMGEDNGFYKVQVAINFYHVID